MTSYAIIGTGALGGYYGARLVQDGAEVHFLSRSDGDWIRHHGLLMESVGRGIIHARARAYDGATDMPRCDVAIVALKTTANDALPELLHPVLKPDGVVLVLQNGLDVERDAARAAPGHLVLGGLCFIGANKIGPGHILHLDYGDILLGWAEETGDRTTADRWMERLAKEFLSARVSVKRVDNLCLARWRKLVWNIPYNGLSVIHRATTDVIMKNQGLRAEVISIMHEVQTIAASRGCLIEEAFIQEMLDVTDRMKPYKTSMLLDFEAGKPLETEVIYNRPLRVAENVGVAAPHIRALYEQLMLC